MEWEDYTWFFRKVRLEMKQERQLSSTTNTLKLLGNEPHSLMLKALPDNLVY